MTTKTFKIKKISIIKEKIIKEAKYNRSDDCYTVTININKRDYTVKLQFVDENKIIVWHAIEEENDTYKKITNSSILHSILYILLWQKVPSFLNFI